jgi:hypothetical protein
MKFHPAVGIGKKWCIRTGLIEQSVQCTGIIEQLPPSRIIHCAVANFVSIELAVAY